MFTESCSQLTCNSGGLAAASTGAISPKFNTKTGSHKELWNLFKARSEKCCFSCEAVMKYFHLGEIPLISYSVKITYFLWKTISLPDTGNC